MGSARHKVQMNLESEFRDLVFNLLSTKGGKLLASLIFTKKAQLSGGVETGHGVMVHL